MMERAGSLVVCDPSDGGRRIIVTMMKTMTMMIKVQRETEHSFASGRRQEYYSRSGGECERGDRDDHISHSRGADRRSGEGHGLGAAQLGRSRGTRSFGDSEWNAFSAQTRPGKRQHGARRATAPWWGSAKAPWWRSATAPQWRRRRRICIRPARPT